MLRLFNFRITKIILICSIFSVLCSACFSLEIRVYDYTGGKYVNNHKVSALFYRGENNATSSVTFMTDLKGRAIYKTERVSPNAVELKSTYHGAVYYHKQSIKDPATQIITFNVYETSSQFKNVRAKLYHGILSGSQNKMIMDVRMVISNGGKYYIAEKGGFSLPVMEGAIIQDSVPRASIINQKIRFSYGLRPGKYIYSYKLAIPYNYKKPYSLTVKMPFPIDNLLLIGDTSFDMKSASRLIKRKVKNVSRDGNLVYLTGKKVSSEVKVLIIPNQRKSYFIVESLIGLFIGAMVLWFLRKKNKSVPSFNNLVENISNKETYDKEVKNSQFILQRKDK